MRFGKIRGLGKLGFTEEEYNNIMKLFLGLRFPVQIDFKSCREEIAGALQEFCNRWCKREHVESNALNSWKLNIFKIIDGRISDKAANNVVVV